MPGFDIQSTQALFGNAGTMIVFRFCHTDVERARLQFDIRHLSFVLSPANSLNRAATKF